SRPGPPPTPPPPAPSRVPSRPGQPAAAAPPPNPTSRPGGSQAPVHPPQPRTWVAPAAPRSDPGVRTCDEPGAPQQLRLLGPPRDATQSAELVGLDTLATWIARRALAFDLSSPGPLLPCPTAIALVG